MKKKISIFLTAILVLTLLVPSFAVFAKAENMVVSDGCIDASVANWTFLSTLGAAPLDVADSFSGADVASVSTFSFGACRARNSLRLDTKLDATKKVTVYASFDQTSDYSVTKGIYLRIATNSTSFTNMNTSYGENPGLDFRVYQKSENTLGIYSYRHQDNSFVNIADAPGNYNEQTKISVKYGVYSGDEGWFVYLNDVLTAFFEVGTNDTWNSGSVPSLRDYINGAYLYIMPIQQGQAGNLSVYTVNATTYDYNNHILDNATCAHDRACSKCGQVMATALAHEYNDFTVTKAPSVSETGSKFRTCNVCGAVDTVEIPKLPAISFEKDSLSISAGKSETLVISTTNVVSGSSIKFKSSDESVAIVSQSGKITTYKEGTVTITVTVEGTDASDTCTLTVTKAQSTSIFQQIIDWFRNLIEMIKSLFSK